MKTVYHWKARWAFEHPIRGRVTTSSDGGPYGSFDNAHQALENAIADKPHSRTLISQKILQTYLEDDAPTIEDRYPQRFAPRA